MSGEEGQALGRGTQGTIYKYQGRRDGLKVEGLKVLYIQMSGEEGQA